MAETTPHFGSWRVLARHFERIAHGEGDRWHHQDVQVRAARLFLAFLERGWRPTGWDDDPFWRSQRAQLPHDSVLAVTSTKPKTGLAIYPPGCAPPPAPDPDLQPVLFALVTWRLPLLLNLLERYEDAFAPDAEDVIRSAPASHPDLAQVEADACELLAIEATWHTPQPDDEPAAKPPAQPAGFTKKQILKKMGGHIGGTKFNGLADAAGVRRPGRGQHGHVYTARDIHLIARQAEDAARFDQAERDRWNGILVELGHPGVESQPKAKRR